MMQLARAIDLSDMAWVAIAAPDGTWYPQSFLARREDNQPSLDAALASVRGVVAALADQGIGRDRIAFIGFSQGACLAAEFVYRDPARWGGLVALTGGIIGPKGTDFPPSGDLQGMPVRLSVSAEDAWVPLWRVQETATLLRTMGAEVQLRVRSGVEHIVDDEEIAQARQVLAAVGQGSGASVRAP
jgi:phospholipase/carboxylesterase